MLMGGRFAVLKFFTVLLVVGLLALAAVACSGGGGEPSQSDETSAVGDGEGPGDLESLAAASAEGVIAKVTYSITTEGGGETFEGEWVLVQRPPDSRIEISSTEGGEEVRTIIISAGGKSYLCFALAGEESCLVTEEDEAGAEAAPLDILFDIPSAIAGGVEGVDIGDASQRTIAGLNAICFTIGGGLVELGEGEVCFSNDGLLLYLQGEAEGISSTFEATSVDTNVTDADFEPPYEVIDLGDLGDFDLDFDLELTVEP